MSNEDVGDDLEGDCLQRWVAFGEAVEEERQVLFSKVLRMLSAIFHLTRIPVLRAASNSPFPADNKVPNKADPSPELEPPDS